MKLEDYISETLLAITNGVAKAQEESLLYIAPGYVNEVQQDGEQQVKIEVATTVSKEGEGGISVLSFGNVSASTVSENINRVEFSVPVFFNAPTIKNKMHYKNQRPIGPLITDPENKN